MMFGFVKKVKMSRFTHTSHYSQAILNALAVIIKLILLNPIQSLFLLPAQAPAPVYVIMPARIVVIQAVQLIRFRRGIAANLLVPHPLLLIVADLLVPVLPLEEDARVVVGRVVVGNFFLLLHLGCLLKKKYGNRYKFTESICEAGI